MITTPIRAIGLSLAFTFGSVSIVVGADPAKLVFHETALDALGRVPVAGRFVKINMAGTLAACLIEHDGKKFVSINGQEGPAFDWIEFRELGVDSGQVIYESNRGGTDASYGNSLGAPRFEGGQWFRVVGREKPVPIDYKTNAGFKYIGQDNSRAVSTDGKKTAIITQTPEGGFSMRVNGKSEKHFDGYFFPIFSPDNERLAYEAFIRKTGQPGGASFIVVDGKRGPYFDGINRYDDKNWLDGYLNGSTVCFSSDSKHIAYTAIQYKDRRDNQIGHVVLDGRDELRPNWHYETPEPVFSADSKWLACGESKEYSTCSVVMRSVEGEVRCQSRLYDMIWLPRNQTTGIIQFFALHDQTIYRVEVAAAD